MKCSWYKVYGVKRAAKSCTSSVFESGANDSATVYDLGLSNPDISDAASALTPSLSRTLRDRDNVTAAFPINGLYDTSRFNLNDFVSINQGTSLSGKTFSISMASSTIEISGVSYFIQYRWSATNGTLYIISDSEPECVGCDLKGSPCPRRSLTGPGDMCKNMYQPRLKVPREQARYEFSTSFACPVVGANHICDGDPMPEYLNGQAIWRGAMGTKCKAHLCWTAPNCEV